VRLQGACRGSAVILYTENEARDLARLERAIRSPFVRASPPTPAQAVGAAAKAAAASVVRDVPESVVEYFERDAAALLASCPGGEGGNLGVVSLILPGSPGVHSVFLAVAPVRDLHWLLPRPVRWRPLCDLCQTVE
jgi:hypothetical protein